MKRNILKPIFIVAVTIIIGLLNWYSTPTMSDDILYHFVWQEEWQQPLEPIESLSDVVRSQIVHYHCVNGRTVCHILAQIGLNLVPEYVVKIINTLVFMLLLWLVNIYISQRKDNQLMVGALSFGLIFLVMSGFNTAFLWLIGSFVYTYSLIFTMCMLLLLRKIKDQPFSKKSLLLLPLCFLFGWSHEAIALPLALAFILYIIVHRKYALSSASTYCMIAYTLGMLMIISSPALWVRADADGITLMQRLISGCMNIATNIRISWLLIITLAIIAIKNRKSIRQRFNGITNGYLLFAWLIAVGIVFVCGTNLDRVGVCADFLALLILLDIWQSKKLSLKRQNLIVIVIVSLSVLIAVPATIYSKQNYDNYLYHCSQLQNKEKTALVRVRQIDDNICWILQQIKNRYVNPTVEYGFYNCYMAFDSHDSNSMAFAALHGKKSVILLPEDVISAIEHDSTAYSHYMADKHDKLYIQRLPDSINVVNKVTFLLGEEVPLKFYQRPLSYPGYEYELDDFKHEVVTVCGRNYLVMTIPTTNIKRRIKDLRIE